MSVLWFGLCSFICHACANPLDSETGWTGELWSKTNFLKWQKSYNRIFFGEAKYVRKKFILEKKFDPSDFFNFQIF